MKTKTKIKRKWGKVKFYYKVNRGALWFAFIAGIIAAIILINSLFNAPKTSPQPQEQTNDVKRVKVADAKERPFCNNVINCIRDVGEELGMSNQDITKMIRIARAESNFNQYAKNPNSTAKGIYQFIDSTWRSNCLKDGNVYDFKDNINCAWKVYQKQGDRPWNASKHIWNK